MGTVTWRVVLLQIGLTVAATGCTSSPPATVVDVATPTTSTPPSTVAATTATVAATTTSSEPPNASAHEVLRWWLPRAAGRAATYQASIGCVECFFGGEYQIAERDGRVDSTDPAEIDGYPFPDGWSLTEVLTRATDPGGTFSVAVSDDDGSVLIVADPEPDAIDDEWTYRADHITVLDQLPNPSNAGNDCRDSAEEDLRLDDEPPTWRPNTEITYTRRGCLVRVDVISSTWGVEHCGTEAVRFLTTGHPLGAPYTGRSDATTFVKDPNDQVGAAAGYELLTELSPNAIGTGYRHGNEQLWLEPQDPDALYVVTFARIERWPRIDDSQIPACD